MKITTEKQKPIKLYDWLKAKTLSLRELIHKKNFNSYSDLISYCDKLGMLPCSEHDFNKSYEELYPKIEVQKQQILEEFETKTLDAETSTLQEEVEVIVQRQSKKKSSQPG